MTLLRRLSLSTGEVVLWLVICNYGLALILPPDRFPNNENFEVMASIAPEKLWGVSFAAYAGLWALVAVVTASSRVCVTRHAYRLRLALYWVAALCTLWMGITFFLSNPMTTGGGPLIAVAIAALWERAGHR